MTATPILAPPDGYEATTEVAHASRVLRYLLTSYPNTVIGHRDVCDVLGREVSPQAVSNAAARLSAGSFGMHIYSRRGLGYVLLTPVAAPGPHSCYSCGYRSIIGTCRRLKGRPVAIGEWCYAWQASS